MGDKVLMQAVEEPVRRGVLLVLVLTNKEGLVGTVGCSSHEIMEFRFLMEESRIAGSWTSGETNQTSSRTYMEASHGIRR